MTRFNPDIDSINFGRLTPEQMIEMNVVPGVSWHVARSDVDQACECRFDPKGRISDIRLTEFTCTDDKGEDWDWGVSLHRAKRLGLFLKAVSASLPEFKIVCQTRDTPPIVIPLTDAARQILDSCFDDTPEEITRLSSVERLVERIEEESGFSRAAIRGQLEHAADLLAALDPDEVEAIKAHLDDTWWRPRLPTGHEAFVELGALDPDERSTKC